MSSSTHTGGLAQSLCTEAYFHVYHRYENSRFESELCIFYSKKYSLTMG